MSLLYTTLVSVMKKSGFIVRGTALGPSRIHLEFEIRMMVSYRKDTSASGACIRCKCFTINTCAYHSVIIAYLYSHIHCLLSLCLYIYLVLLQFSSINSFLHICLFCYGCSFLVFNLLKTGSKTWTQILLNADFFLTTTIQLPTFYNTLTLSLLAVNFEDC